MAAPHVSSHTGQSGHTGAAAYVIAPIAVVAVVATLAVWMWLRFFQGRQSFLRGSRGPTTLVDYADGRAGFLGTVLICLFGLLQGGLLLIGGVLGFMKSPLQALVIALIGAGVLWLTQWYYRRRRRVVTVAKPGALVVPYWPLVEGQTINVAYQRELQGDQCKLKQLFAELQLFETHRTYNHAKRRYDTHVTLIERRNLGDGGGRQAAEGLHAIWNFHVPHPQGERPRVGFDALLSALGLGPKRQWRLRVHLNVEGLPDVDSSFDLLIRASGNARLPDASSRLAG